jgi:trimethylamine:corrinoid methyltransferase-like protein
MALGAGPLHARTSSGATGIVDLESGQRREPTRQDAVYAVRLADALRHVHGVSTITVQPADVPASMVNMVRAAMGGRSNGWLDHQGKDNSTFLLEGSFNWLFCWLNGRD